MRTLFVTDPPEVVDDWLADRRALGQDRFDEVWEGEYHVAPAPSGRHAKIDDRLGRLLGPLADRAELVGATTCNIGRDGDYRVPDRAYFRDGGDDVWNPSSAIVVEIVSPGDESHAKLGFYFRVGVAEVLIVDPEAHAVEWFVRGAETFVPTDRSTLLGITSDELAAALDGPA